MADPRQFVLNSDYPMDKIIYLATPQYTFTSELNVTIPHTYPFKPLVFGYWSLTPDFSTAQTINDSNYVDMPSVEIMVESTDTDVRITGLSYINGPVTVYLRLFAFEPADSAATIATNSNLAQTWLRNSEYNYLKLADAGVRDVRGTSATIPHNLGYIPQVLAWEEVRDTATTTKVLLLDQSEAGAESVLVDNNNLYLDGQAYTSGVFKIHYRIYADAA